MLGSALAINLRVDLVSVMSRLCRRSDHVSDSQCFRFARTYMIETHAEPHFGSGVEGDRQDS
jgi:hypothetical protein